MSCQPCGCDPEEGHQCENVNCATRRAEELSRRMEVLDELNEKNTFTVKGTERIKFASGSVRDNAEGKVKWSRITYGPMMFRWADHLTKAEARYPDPKPDGVPNFMLISTDEEFLRYRESAFRHFMQWFNGEMDEDHAAAVFFNINGVEIIKDKKRKKGTP